MSVYFKEQPEYLRQSIESMLSQTVPPDEIIIVKDGPLTEELNSVIDNYSSDKHLFTVIPLETNSGLGNALNIGLKNSRNELVARMDSDDICYPDRCEKTLACFENDSELTIVGGQIEEFSGDTKNVLSKRVVPTDYEKIIKFSKRRSPFNHPTVIYKKSIILKEGGYPSSGRKEDLDLFLLILSKGYKVANIEDAVLHYRASDNNLKRRKNWKNCKEYIHIIKKYKKLGYCSFLDVLCVSFGQLLFFLSPVWLLKILNKRILRKQVQK